MRNVRGWAVAGVLAAVVAGVTVAAPMVVPDKPAVPDKPLKEREKEKATTLKGRVAAETKLAEDDVAKVLEALGPAVREQLARGDKVELPGLGVLRVVRIPEHRDLVDGRPATIAATNYIDFLPTGELVQASNAPGAVPQETVPPFEYNPLPGQTKSQHAPDERMPNVRTR